MNASSKGLKWFIYYLKTDVLSAETNDSGWVLCNDRVNMDSFIDINVQIEERLGQFTSDSLKLSLLGISWWRANVFDGTKKYTEFKIIAQFDPYTSDTFPMFLGFVDPEMDLDEFKDELSITAFTVDQLGSRIPVELATTQYLINNAGTTGVMLPLLPGIYITDANVTSYVLSPGVHTINYQYSGGNHQLQLNGSRWQTVTGGIGKTIDDGPTGSADAKHKVTLNIVEFPASGSSDTFIVVMRGNQYPNNWYYHISAKRLLIALYASLGISNLTVDKLFINSWDSRYLITYIEPPSTNPADWKADYRAATTDGTYLWIGVQNKLYRRNVTTDVFTLMATLGSNVNISKLVYNSRNNHLWLFTYDSGLGQYSIYLYEVTGNTVSSNHIDFSTGLTSQYCFEVFDNNYTGSSWKYGAFYGLNNSAARFITYSAGTLSDSAILSDSNVKALIAFRKNSNNEVYVSYGASTLLKFTVNSSGNWVYNLGSGNLSWIGGISGGVYLESEGSAGRVYCFNGGVLSYTDINSVSITATSTVINGPYDLQVLSGAIYSAAENSTNNGCLIKAQNGTATILQAEDHLDYLSNFSLVLLSGILYGVNDISVLYQYHNTEAMYVGYTESFAGMTTYDALKLVLNSFMLMATISPNHSALIYRRSDMTGALVNSGSPPLVVNETIGCTLTQAERRWRKADLAKVSNNVISTSYDGTNWDSAVLSDGYQYDLNSSIIPSAIIPDICFYVYKALSTDRQLYTLNLGGYPAFQYEPFDPCSLSLTLTKIQKSGTGVLYSITYGINGTMTIGVLI